MWTELDMALALTCVAARAMTGLPVERVDSELAPCWTIHNAEDVRGWRYIVATCTMLFATVGGVRFQFAEYEGQAIADRLLEDLPFVPDAVDWAYNHVLLERERKGSA